MTTPLEPSVSTRPANTLTPLNASELLPGRYGYETVIANNHNMTDAIRLVAWAISGCIQLICNCPASTLEQNLVSEREAKRVITTMMRTMNKPGKEPTMPWVIIINTDHNQVPKVCDHGLV